MVKASDINKDIRSIAKKVGAAVFSYDDIHNSGINNEFHYDYERVISEVAKLNGWSREETISNLEAQEILISLPNGEYKVDVGDSTRGGGGINYGLAFFVANDKDYVVKYHELAHSLQAEYKLFDAEKIDELYSNSAKGLKDKADDKLIDKTNYKSYLKEMHSESFAYAAMMLRAENPLDFEKQVSRAYNDASCRNFEGFLSFGKTVYGAKKGQNSAKFYSNLPVIKETIKIVMAIRKKGEVKNYFDENGVLKDEKLAKLCEQIVVKSAYSPRTLNSYFNYDFFDGHKNNEHGWKKDTLEGFYNGIKSVFTTVSVKSTKERIKSLIKHNKLLSEEKAKIGKIFEQASKSKDPEMMALHGYLSYLDKCEQLGKGYTDDFTYDIVRSVLNDEKPSIHKPYLIERAKWLLDVKKSNKKTILLADKLAGLQKEIIELSKNPYFAHIIQEGLSKNDVMKMYFDKYKNMDKTIIDNPKPIVPKANIKTPKRARSVITKDMNKITKFCEKWNCSKEFKQELFNTMLSGCEKLDSKDTRKSLASKKKFNIFLGIDFNSEKFRFKKELNELLVGMSGDSYSQRKNTAYAIFTDELKGKSFDEATQFIAEMNISKGNNDSVAYGQAQINLEQNIGKKQTNLDQEKGVSVEPEVVTDDVVLADMPPEWTEHSKSQFSNDDVVLADLPPEFNMTPKERVTDKLSKWGIEEGSYIIITPEDNAYVGLSGSNVKSVSTYFENGAKEATNKASKVVYGENNGLVGAYFDDGVYVVSNNAKLRDVLSREAVDVGLGVMLSNGESFKIANGNDNSILNHKWNLTKDTGEEVNKIFKQKQEQHDEVLGIKEQKENVVTGAEKLSNTVQKLCEFADSHDNTGALKERLVTTFIKDDEKLNTLDFWGGCAKDFAKGSPVGQDNFVKELGKIGISTVKDIKDNKENTQYVAVKNRCKEETSVEGMVKTAKVCANRSKISVNTKTTDGISM